MDLREAIQFIRGAFIQNTQEQVWADLGCGSGLFSKALAHLLPGGSTVFAIDRTPQQLPEINNHTHIRFLQADFLTETLPLSILDGILMANSLHFIREPRPLLHKLASHFSESARYIIIEYDMNTGNQWVPYPVSFERLSAIGREAGFGSVTKIAERPSAFGHANMYAALVTGAW